MNDISAMKIPAVDSLEKEMLKRKLERTYLEFAKWNFKETTRQDLIISDHHEVMADGFQRVLDGEIKLLLITVPPRYTKTEFVKQFCAAGFARNAASQYIYTSYSDTLAMKCSNEIKDGISHENFQKIWPIKIKKDVNAKKLWETEAGGGLFATSFGGPIVGFGAGKMDGYKSPTKWEFNGAIIIDDPIKTQDRHRAIARADVIDYFTGTLPSRFNSQSVPLIVIMQRLHKEDLAGHVVENDSDREGFLHINLPAIKENGEPLWPAKHSLEALERMAKNNEMFQSQYMQQPIVLGGNLIKSSEFKRYGILPFLNRRFITADTALKDKEHNDFTVFQCWGVGKDNALYLIDNLRIKIQSKDLKGRFIDFWNKHNNLEVMQYGNLTCAYVEDKASGTQLIQELRAEARIPIVAVQRSRSKLERVLDILLPRLASGYIFIPEEATWISDFLNECEEFNASMSHKHDDQIDPLVDAVEIGSGITSGVDSGQIMSNNLNRHRKTARRNRR